MVCLLRIFRVTLLFGFVSAFSQQALVKTATRSTFVHHRIHHGNPLYSAINKEEDASGEVVPSKTELQYPFDKQPRVIVQGSADDYLTDEEWEAMEKEKVPLNKFQSMQMFMGINGFTYLLALLALSFLALNQILGPGWLGQALGMKGVGSLGTQLGESVPDMVDLNSSPDFLLK